MGYDLPWMIDNEISFPGTNIKFVEYYLWSCGIIALIVVILIIVLILIY